MLKKKNKDKPTKMDFPINILIIGNLWVKICKKFYLMWEIIWAIMSRSSDSVDIFLNEE